MKKIIVFLIFINMLLASIEINSFEADFIQIVKESKKTIKYYGKLYFKKPMKILWKYIKPVKKEIYIVDDQVVVIEPEIEQATISHFTKTKNIIEILKKAKKIDKNTLLAKYQNQNFYIYLDNKGKLKKIVFKDKLENEIIIVFKNQKQNIKIEDKIFEYKIDPEFDIIFQ